LRDAEAAYLEACRTILDMSFEMLRSRIDPSRYAFEIADADGALIFELPFSEVLRPAHHAQPAGDLHASIRRHQQRATAVTAELKTNFDRTRLLLADTRALLARV